MSFNCQSAFFLVFLLCVSYMFTLLFDPTFFLYQPLPSVGLQETFQWNGITSKKKGQKWGKENSSSSKKNEFRDFHEESESSDMPVIKQNAKANDQIDFDKLMPFATLPKVCVRCICSFFYLYSSIKPYVKLKSLGFKSNLAIFCCLSNPKSLSSL